MYRENRSFIKWSFIKFDLDQAIWIMDTKQLIIIQKRCWWEDSYILYHYEVRLIEIVRILVDRYFLIDHTCQPIVISCYVWELVHFSSAAPCGKRFLFACDSQIGRTRICNTPVSGEKWCQVPASSTVCQTQAQPRDVSQNRARPVPIFALL